MLNSEMCSVKRCSKAILPCSWTNPISNSVLGLLYGHGILTIYENLLL